ncbi:MAG TPA: lysylphosphatidylglycerol synthase transmembrane domain-containing protein [Vicinamibacterales bacterium]|jgi:hypothetical protein|nr:lysylphosphatidylglycerol synthase transmembrane domain-containing protein [Vicinamibacterales bacterium]
MGTQNTRPPASGIRPQGASDIRPRQGSGFNEAFGWKTVLLSLLAIALLAWFLRNADMAGVWSHIRRARIDLLLLTLVIIAVTFIMRTVRWQHLLRPIGETRFRTAFRATVIGFAAIQVLPARAGELLRPYLLARQEGFSTSSTFATIVMERVTDMVAVVTLLAAFVWVFGGRQTVPPPLLGPIEISAALAALAAAVLFGVMWTLATHPERVARLVLRCGRMLPPRVAHGLSALARTFSQGFAAAREPRAVIMALLWSFPIWIAISLETWLITIAFDIDLPFAGSFLMQALLVIGIAVPTPGGIGGFHEAYRIGVTTFFGASNDAAVGAAIVLWAIGFVPVTIAGVIFMVRDGLSLAGLRRLAGAARREETTVTDEVPVLRSSRR